MTLENEQQYRNTLREYRKIRREIEDALISGATEKTDDGLRGGRDIMHDLEDDLIEYEELHGKALITQRTPWVQTDDDLAVLTEYLERQTQRSIAEGVVSESVGLDLVRKDIEQYRSRRKKRDSVRDPSSQTTQR